jgi:hypothetical protein
MHLPGNNAHCPAIWCKWASMHPPESGYEGRGLAYP